MLPGHFLEQASADSNILTQRAQLHIHFELVQYANRVRLFGSSGFRLHDSKLAGQ
jgi:hypothetical protein